MIKMLRRIKEKLDKMHKDRRGQLMWIGLAIMILFVLLFFGLAWMIIMNFETLGKGFLYIALGLGVIIGVGVIAKKLLEKPLKGVS